jgi:hypothetical protein
VRIYRLEVSGSNPPAEPPFSVPFWFKTPRQPLGTAFRAAFYVRPSARRSLSCPPAAPLSGCTGACTAGPFAAPVPLSALGTSTRHRDGAEIQITPIEFLTIKVADVRVRYGCGCGWCEMCKNTKE